MAKRGVGRPRFKPTAAHRRQVEELVSCGMGEDSVAAVIGVSRPTLRLYFADQLDHGRARKKAEVISLLYRTARKGNVTAQKKLNEMIAIAEAADYGKENLPDQDDATRRDQPPRPPKLGKKEEADLAAQTAGEGTDWGDDLKVPTTLN